MRAWQTSATVARRTAVTANQAYKRIRDRRFGPNRGKGGDQMSLDAEKHERISELFSAYCRGRISRRDLLSEGGVAI